MSNDVIVFEGEAKGIGISTNDESIYNAIDVIFNVGVQQIYKRRRHGTIQKLIGLYDRENIVCMLIWNSCNISWVDERGNTCPHACIRIDANLTKIVKFHRYV